MIRLYDTITLGMTVRILIRLRLKEMRVRHDCALYSAFTDLAKAPEQIERSDAARCLPPRRQWVRPKRDRRAGRSNDEITAMAIRRAVDARQRAGTLDQVEWGRNLLALVEKVKEIAGCGTHGFSRPAVMALAKGIGKQHRVVAPCATLIDRVVSGYLARYLDGLVEPLLGPNCFSFRVNGVTHHDAILGLRDYRSTHSGKRIYVAECDIRGFYDSLAHRVARDAVLQAAKERNIVLDPAALSLLDSLLKSYSFPAFGRPEALKQVAQKKAGISIDWLDKKERDALYGDVPDDEIGIPQGNPVSPILSNLVLMKADRGVEAILGADGFYARYCDDVIMAHPHKKVCEAALAAYQEVLKKLLLPVHRPKSIPAYGRDFWGLKSRKPYRWDDPETTQSAVPWVQFVGYQVRFDGSVRIRKDSLVKQKKAISEVVDRTVHLIKKSKKTGRELKKSGESIFWRIATRILNAGVGKRRSTGGKKPASEPCWIDAFPCIDASRFTRSQMRELDRHREIQFRRLRHVVGKLLPAPEPQPSGGAQVEEKKRKRPFFGAPYSYFGHIGETQGRRDFRVSGYGLEKSRRSTGAKQAPESDPS